MYIIKIYTIVIYSISVMHFRIWFNTTHILVKRTGYEKHIQYLHKYIFFNLISQNYHFTNISI